MKLKTLRICLVFAAVALLLCISAFALDVKTADELRAALENNENISIKANIVINDPSMFNYDENGVIVSAKEGAVEWTPITKYTGTLSSSPQYCITGLYIPASKAVNGMSGLVAEADGATFTNINIDFALVESTEYAGILAGKATNTTVNFNMVYGSVIGKTTQVQNTAGGIVGYFGENSVMSRSVSYATVSGANAYSSNIGGIAGYNAGEIKNSASDANVAGIAKYYDAAVGGIAGTNVGKIQNCTSQATVKGETTSPVNDVYVGGIAGVNKGIVTQVKNTGAITVAHINNSSNSIGAAGGIVGMLVDADLVNVSNEGTVTGDYSYNGGIVGIAISTDGKHTVSNAKNTGSVTDANGVKGGIAGRAVAAGEGYVSTIMNFENCETTSGTLYGEMGTVESATVTGALGTATITAPTTRNIVPINAEDNQFIVTGGTVSAKWNGSTNALTAETLDGKIVIRFRASAPTLDTSTAPLTPKPLLITVIEVADLNAMEIISVDKSALTLADDKLNGTVVVKVYNPNLVNATTILGTSVDTQFVSAKFGNLDTTNKLTTLEINFSNVSALSATGNVVVNAMVVDTTDNMAPLCANKGA